jgi:hypothetical protein
MKLQAIIFDQQAAAPPAKAPPTAPTAAPETVPMTGNVIVPTPAPSTKPRSPPPTIPAAHFHQLPPSINSICSKHNDCIFFHLKIYIPHFITALLRAKVYSPSGDQP